MKYSVTFSGPYSLKQTEDLESQTGETLSGQVGPHPWENTTDKRDVIHYSGQVTDLDLSGNGSVKLKIDGKTVNPRSLKATPSGSPNVTTVDRTPVPPLNRTSTSSAETTHTSVPPPPDGETTAHTPVDTPSGSTDGLNSEATTTDGTRDGAGSGGLGLVEIILIVIVGIVTLGGVVLLALLR